MTKFKVQIEPKGHEMPKQVRHDKGVILNLALKPVQGLRFQNPFLKFDIHLAFACLREAPPAKALCGG